MVSFLQKMILKNYNFEKPFSEDILATQESIRKRSLKFFLEEGASLAK